MSVNVYSPVYYLNEWEYSNETDHSWSLAGPQNTDDIEKVTGSKVKGRDHMTAIASVPLKGYEPKLTKLFPIVWRQTDYVFKVTTSKLKVTD